MEQMKMKAELKFITLGGTAGGTAVGTAFAMIDGMTMMRLLYVNSWATLEDQQALVVYLVEASDHC